MGWWSATVMGGDTPCDYIYDLEQAAMINMDDEPSLRIMREAINLHLKEVFDAAKNLDDPIAAQVLGVFIITNGAKMTEEIREFIIQGCNSDEWAKEDAERRKFVSHFRRQIRRYPSKGSVRGYTVAYEGLFQKMAEHIAEGKSGLINKNR